MKKSITWLIFSFLLVTALVLSSCGPAAEGEQEEEEEAPPGRIVFTSDRDGDREIYVMDADGSNQQRLTDNLDIDMYPSWSPDGSHIAFVSDRAEGIVAFSGGFNIYVMDTDGSNQQRLNDRSLIDRYYSWSPDGSRIAFYAYPGGRIGRNAEIYVVDADGSNEQRLTDNPASDAHPSWSPDGSRIAFDSYRDGNKEIYVMDADGANQQRLTFDPAVDYKPSLFP